MAGECNADVEANAMMVSLLAGETFTIPDVNFNDPEFVIPDLGDIPTPVALTNDALTTKTIGGTGTFDVIMASVMAHLGGEYEKNRITGAEYTKAYIAMGEAALTNAVQFLMQRDAAYYQALKGKSDALIAAAQLATARVGLETAKAQLAAVRIEASNQKANYALTKMKLATESAGYCTAEYNLSTLLPLQKKNLEEQVEVTRAQTMDTRSDGVTPVTGSVGKQKQLYDQQITSYKRDAELKAAKLFTDAWTVMKTADENAPIPLNFDNVSLNAILASIKTNNLIG